MRTIAQILDELGNCEFERMEIARIEKQLEEELTEVEQGMSWEDIDTAYDDYYSETNDMDSHG